MGRESTCSSGRTVALSKESARAQKMGAAQSPPMAVMPGTIQMAKAQAMASTSQVPRNFMRSSSVRFH